MPDPLPTAKACTACGETKPLDGFYLSRPQCKACDRLEQNRNWRKRERETLRAWHQAWREANPEKYAAHRAIEYDLRRGGGTLTRPEACEDCGKVTKPVAHHADYSKPLDVEWLCRRCHAARHEDQYQEQAS